MITREYRNTRFLIIDTVPEARLKLEKILRTLGAWYIEMAVDGTQAVERCRNGLFDVVICAYQLDGRNGQQVLEELRERKILRYTSVFIMTAAETTREMVLAAIDHQPDAYITQPIEASVLQTKLDSLLIDSDALYDIRHAMDMNRLSEAISRCEEKIHKGSKYRRWCEKTVAELYFREQDYDEAERIYQRVIAEKPLIWAQIGLARVFRVRARYEEAECLLRKVVDHAPNCLQASDLLAEIWQEMGKTQDAQSLMQSAVSKAPSAIRRQAYLGELSWELQDIDTATEAYRNAVELGEKSVYDCAANHLRFARALCEKSECLPKELREKQAAEAVAVLERAEKKHELEKKESFQRAVLSAKLCQRLRDKDSLEQALEEAEGLYQEVGLELECDYTLEYAEALLNNECDMQAEFVLSQVQLVHGADEAVMQRVAQIREEPVSAGARQRAAELNRNGIRMAEEGNLPGALEIFTDALEYSPRHPALNLNFVQVLLKHWVAGGKDPQTLDYAQDCLGRLSHLPETHGQYARYRHLQKKLESLINRGESP